jgi:hypothetical protein
MRIPAMAAEPPHISGIGYGKDFNFRSGAVGGEPEGLRQGQEPGVEATGCPSRLRPDGAAEETGKGKGQ